MAKNKLSVSFIISTYNGLKLLRANLPSVFAAAEDRDEVIIADDASSDLTVPYFRHQYNLDLVDANDQYHLYRGIFEVNNKKIILTLLSQQKNLRFAENNNWAVKLAKHELVMLLNNDCSIRTGAMAALRGHFASAKDSASIFAVTAMEVSPYQNNEQHGKNSLFFKKGRFQHSKALDWEAGETAWACGGSSLYDRQKFLELGGFDKIYYPAYWEDIDLSFQARQKGWQIIFEPTAIIDHNHETTNQDVFGQQKIDRMSWKNGTKFTWKNSTWKQKLQFILWTPYWFALRQPFWFLLIIILLFSSIIRFYHLGKLPAGLTWDEAAIGYNGWSIINSRRDEWLTKLPISFRSFGDYKAPLAIYINGISTFIFGLNPMAVRLPFAVFSVLALLGFALLVKLILDQNLSKFSQQITLLTTLTLSLTPWHFFFSRVGFEAGIALALIIWACYFFLLYIYDQKENVWQKWWAIVLSLSLLNVSFYVYHSSKVVAPLLVCGLLIMSIGKINRKFTPFLAALLVSLILLIPFTYDAIKGHGLTRAGSSFLVSSELNATTKVNMIVSGIWQQFQPSFLINGATGPDGLRHGTGGGWGVFLLPTYFLIIIGIFATPFLLKKSSFSWGKLYLFAWSLTLIGLLPAAIATDLPHANRALLALPGFMLFFVLGLQTLLSLKPEKELVTRSILCTITLLQLLFGLSFLHYYFTVYPLDRATDRAYNTGYLEAFALSHQYESQVDKVLFTSEYGQPYIFALFARQTPAIYWQGGSLNKYEFTDHFNPGDLERSNTLIVVGESDFDQLPSSAAFKTLTSPNGRPRFKFFLTPTKVLESVE